MDVLRDFRASFAQRIGEVVDRYREDTLMGTVGRPADSERWKVPIGAVYEQAKTRAMREGKTLFSVRHDRTECDLVYQFAREDGFVAPSRGNYETTFRVPYKRERDGEY